MEFRCAWFNFMGCADLLVVFGRAFLPPAAGFEGFSRGSQMIDEQSDEYTLNPPVLIAMRETQQCECFRSLLKEVSKLFWTRAREDAARYILTEQGEVYVSRL